jgi:hypothetical protein
MNAPGLWPLDCQIVAKHPSEDLVKRTALLFILALIATPTLVRAHDNDRERKEDHDRDDRPNVSAKEMAGIGLAGAALLGVAGYAILRKRNISA